MAIEIGREQRDAIYEELMDELTGSGDIWTEVQAGKHEAARRTRRRLEDDMRLLDDLGWEPEQDREVFELTMPSADLARALRVLGENARATLQEHVVRPIAEADLAKRAVIAQTAYLLYGAAMSHIQSFERSLAFLSLVATTDPAARSEGNLDDLRKAFDRWWQAYQKDTAGRTLTKIEGTIPDDSTRNSSCSSDVATGLPIGSLLSNARTAEMEVIDSLSGRWQSWSRSLRIACGWLRASVRRV